MKSLSPIAWILTLGWFVGCGSVEMTGGTTLDRRSDRVITQLPNGLIVIAQRTAAAPVVSVQCWVKTGSIYEQEFNGLGLSHFLEHLVAGGSTTTRTEDESNAILGRIGGQTNAATGLDTVHYYVNTTSEHTETAVDLMSDWIRNSTIGQREFDREMQVIGREFAMGRGEPGRIMWKMTQEVRYPSNHPARHPTIGYEAEFVEVTRDQVYDFYRRMYVPNNMVFVVVGDIAPSRVTEQVARLWADSKPGPLPQIVIPKEKPITEPRTIVGQADVEFPRFQLSWVGAEMATEEDYALDLLGRVLGEGELSRLSKNVRDKGLALQTGAGNWSFSFGRGMFVVNAMAQPDKLDQAKAAVLQEIQHITEQGVSDEELRRAKNKTIAEVVYAVQTAEEAADRLATDFIYTGDPDYVKNYAQAVEKISSEQVRAAAKKFLQPEGMMSVQLSPGELTHEGERPADSPRGLVLAEGPETETLSLDNSQLIEKFNSVQSVATGKSSLRSSPTRLHKLPNGLRVLVQSDNRIPIAAIQWVQLGGLLGEEAGREGVANAASTLFLKGAGSRTADQIAGQLELMGAQMGASAGNATTSVTAQCLAKDWKSVLELTADVVLRPTFPADEWAQVQPRLLAAIDSQNDVWYTQLRSALREAYFGRHPWSQSPLGRRSVVEALTVEQMSEFHSKRLGANQAVLAVFGDVDESQVLAEVARLFGDMPASPSVPFQPPAYVRSKTGYVHVETSKPTPAVVIGYGPGVAVTDEDYQAMQVMNSVMSSFPVGWLDQALRGEGQGLVYAVGAGVFSGPIPGYWSVLFNTQNETINPAMEKAVKVVDRIRNEIVDEPTLARARQAVLVDEAFSRQAPAQRATAAALDELYGLGFNHAEKSIDQIRQVTAQDIHRVARKYIQDPVGIILSNVQPETDKLPPLK